MEKYVVSRELAEKLKEAGFTQSTIHEWYQFSNGQWGVIVRATQIRDVAADFAAPLSDELLEQLPKDVIIGTYIYAPKVVAEYRHGERRGHGRSQKLHLANALAELWLWCKENGTLTKA